ncbi:hypothetical protein KCU59_g93, partial [Aureobasidium melanogenum]
LKNFSLFSSFFTRPLGCAGVTLSHSGRFFCCFEAFVLFFFNHSLRERVHRFQSQGKPQFTVHHAQKSIIIRWFLSSLFCLLMSFVPVDQSGHATLDAGFLEQDDNSISLSFGGWKERCSKTRRVSPTICKGGFCLSDCCLCLLRDIIFFFFWRQSRVLRIHVNFPRDVKHFLCDLSHRSFKLYSEFGSEICVIYLS